MSKVSFGGRLLMIYEDALKFILKQLEKNKGSIVLVDTTNEDYEETEEYGNCPTIYARNKHGDQVSVGSTSVTVIKFDRQRNIIIVVDDPPNEELHLLDQTTDDIISIADAIFDL